MSSEEKKEYEIRKVSMPEEIRHWARSQTTKKFYLGGMQFKLGNAILNNIIVLGIEEQNIEEIKIIYPTYTHNLLKEDYNITYLFTSTDIKIITNIGYYEDFINMNGSYIHDLPSIEFKKILDEAALYERIRLVNLEKAEAEAEARVKAEAEAREKAEIERKKADEDLEAEAAAEESQRKKNRGKSSKSAAAPKPSELSVAAAAAAAPAESRPSKSFAVELKESEGSEEFEEFDINEIDLETFVKSSSKASHAVVKSVPAVVKAAHEVVKASVSAASNSSSSNSSSSSTVAVKLLMPKKIKPSIFREYNLNSAIVSALQNGHNIFHKSKLYKSSDPATDPHANQNKQIFYFFNIDKRNPECMHLTFAPNGIHITLDLINDPTKNKYKYINLNLEFSRSTGRLRILSNDGILITPEYISNKYNRALLELNSGGAGSKALDYRYCQFEMKADILLSFLYDMIPKCIQTGTLVLANEIAGGNYYEKYMKYKTKYLKLKQLMESI